MSEEKKNYVFIGGRMQGKTRDLIQQLIEENKSLQQKVEQLENIRKEAIEYIEENCTDYLDENGKIKYSLVVAKPLLNKLNKGSE